VLTFGSTVGVEATYWGGISILAGGRSFYEHLEVSYQPKTHEDLMGLLLNPTLPPKPKENALLYGAWEANYGIPYRWFNADGFFRGTFTGVRISPSLWIRVVRKLSQWKALALSKVFKCEG
jgi:hypothetical protein